jgi:LacI family transcriptional regulator
VAEEAGVSTATVSRVLSQSDHPVRAETRERVLEAAAMLRFRPSRVARSLVTSRTHTIGAIVHDVADPYFGEILRGMEDACHDNGYQLVACSSDRDAARELGYVEHLLAQRVDGIIFVGGGIEDEAYQRKLGDLLDAYREGGGVVVLLAPSAYHAPSVVPDNAAGGAAMAEYLIGMGHRRIGFVGGPPNIRTSIVRQRAYRDVLVRHGLEDEALGESGHFTLDGGAKAAAAIRRRIPDVTAIFAVNDLMAFGVLQHLSSEGVKVPEQVSVAGFDDIQIAEFVRPGLTTVAVGTFRLGLEGTRLAIRLLANEPGPSKTLPVELVVRASTGQPPGGDLRRTRER